MSHSRIVTLRPVMEEDLPDLCRQMASAEGRTPFEPSKLHSAQAIRKRFAEDGYSNEQHERLVVCDELGQRIGHVMHFAAHRYSTAREMGWGIEPAFRGQGYGAAAVQALVDYLFETLPIHRVCCATAPDNQASRRVAEKAGLQYEGLLRGTVFIRGTHVDSAFYGLLRPDWEQQRGLKA